MGNFQFIGAEEGQTAHGNEKSSYIPRPIRIPRIRGVIGIPIQLAIGMTHTMVIVSNPDYIKPTEPEIITPEPESELIFIPEPIIEPIVEPIIEPIEIEIEQVKHVAHAPILIEEDDDDDDYIPSHTTIPVIEVPIIDPVLETLLESPIPKSTVFMTDDNMVSPMNQIKPITPPTSISISVYGVRELMQMRDERK